MSVHQFPGFVPIPRTCSHHHRREPSQLPPFLPRCNTTSLQAHLGNRFISPATNPLRSINLESRKSFSARIQHRVSAARALVVFVSGRSCTLRDVEGREYLDMAAGIAVNSLGHSDLNCVRVVTEQAATLTHVSNDFHSTPQVELAKRLVGCSFGDHVFFTNSGTEANEAAIKFARKFQLLSHPDEKNAAKEFISFTNCSKGRIMGAFALTRKEHYISPFEPVMPGVTFLEYGDIDAARQAIQRGKIAGVFVEPIQGEGAIYSATKEFLQALRKSCDDADALLVFDEVQCGPGRSGILSAHEAYGVVPDIMTLGKSLAGCLPIGAVLTTEKVAAAIKPWDHGSTFAILSDSTKSCFCNRH